MARVPEAIRLRQHRELFQRAVRDGITIEEARRRICDERRHVRPPAPALCEDEGREPRFWWQK